MSTASTPPEPPSIQGTLLKYTSTVGATAVIAALIAVPVSKNFLEGENKTLNAENTTLKTQNASSQQDLAAAISKGKDLDEKLKSSNQQNTEFRLQIEKLGASAAAPRNPGNEQKAVEAAKDYFSSIRDQDWKKAYNRTTQEFQTAVFKGSPDNLRAEFKDYQPEIKNVATYQQEDKSILIYGSFTGYRKNVEYIRIILRGPDASGEWKIDKTNSLINPANQK